MGAGGAYDVFGRDDSGGEEKYWESPMQVEMHPQVNGSLFLLADRDNMYRSDDYGKSWIPRTHRINDPININAVAWNLTDSTGGSIAMSYGVGDYFSAISGGIMWSDNGGDTWEKLSCSTCPTTPIYAMAFSKSPGSKVVYAGSGMKGGCGSPGDGRGPQIFYSYDAGASWTQQKQFATGVTCMSIEQIIIDPHSDNTTYIKTSNGYRPGVTMVGMLVMSVNNGADYFQLTATPLTFPSGVSRVISMSMNAIGTKWLVSYTDGRFYLGSRTLSQNYTNNSWWAGVDYTAPISDWKVEILDQYTREHVNHVLIDTYSSVNHTQIFYTKRNSSVSDGLFMANLTGDYPASTITDETLIGEVTLAKEPGYNLTKWSVDSFAVQPVTRQPLGLMDERSEAYAAYRRGGHTMYLTSGRNLFQTQYRMRAEDSEHQEAKESGLKTAFGDWKAVYTRTPTASDGFINRGWNNHKYTLVTHQHENPLFMFLGSESEIGFLSITAGGTWTSMQDHIIAASLSNGDTTKWRRASAAVSLRTLPNQFLISTHSVAGKVHSDRNAGLGHPGLFIHHHGEQVAYVHIPIMDTAINESDVQPNGDHKWNNMSYAEFTGLNSKEIGAIAADEWSTDRAIIGNDAGAVFMVSNLQGAIDGLSAPEFKLIGHNYFVPNFQNFSNLTNLTALSVNDNTKYMGNCSQVNSITACPYCGYETYFVICSEGVYRYNETGREPFYDPPRGGTLEARLFYNATKEGMPPGVYGSHCNPCPADDWINGVIANGQSYWFPSAVSPAEHYHRDPYRRRAPDVVYIKYEEFYKLVPSPWETLYLLSNETVYASIDSGSSWTEILLAGYIGPRPVPIAFEIVWPYKNYLINDDKRNLGFTGMAVTGDAEKNIYVAVRGYNRVFDDELYVEEKLSTCILLGVPADGYTLNATVYTWSVLEKHTGLGELGLKTNMLFSAPPIGLGTHERVYAITEHQGLWLHDPGNLLKNPGAEIGTSGPNVAGVYSGTALHWTAGGHSSTGLGAWDNSHASHGFKSFGLPTIGAYWRSDKIDVDPALQYRFTGYTQGKVRVRVIQYWGTVSQDHVKTETEEAVAPGGWSYFRVDFVLNLHINAVAIQVESIDTTPSAADHLWFGPVVNDVVPDSLSPQIPVQGMNVSYAPGAPKPPTVKAFDSTSVTLQWDLPDGHEYLEPIISYSIYRRLAGIGHEYDAFTKVADISQLGGDVRTHKVTGLLYGTNYQFVLYASTGVGASNQSGPLIASTGPQLATAPGQPQLFGTASSSYITLQYAPPSSDGNTPILNYKVYTADPTVGTYDSGQLVDASGKAIIRNLKTANFYIFKVSAINIIGEGPQSSVSPMLMTKNEQECNVTMRFYPREHFSKSTSAYPVGYGTEANFRELIELDVARSIGIPQVRINFIQRTDRYFSFWIRSVGGSSSTSVEEAKYRLSLDIVDTTSALHKGVLTYQTDTHYLLYNGQNADLAAARLIKGGPTQRLDQWTGVICGLIMFIAIPTGYTLRHMYDEYQERLLVAELYKDKYKDNFVDGTD